MRRFIQSCCLSAFLMLCLATAHAQSFAQNLFTSAEERLQAGDAKGAAELYQQIISQYPTFEALGAVKYNLALAYLYSGNSEKAVAQFKELAADSNKDASLREQAALGLGTAEMNLARSQTELQGQSKTLEQSIQDYEIFLKKYPQSSARGEAFFGKACSEFYDEKYADAEKTLTAFFSISASASLRNDATYLQARALSAEAVQLKDQKRDHDAQLKVEEAMKLLDQVANNPQNVVAGNDALFTAGETLFNIGRYSEAIEFLRRIKSKKYLEDEQSKIVDMLRKERAQAMIGANGDLQADVNRQYVRAATRLQEIQTKSSLYINAQLVIAQCLYEQKKYDEVVILARHYMPFCDTEQKKRVVYFLIKALLQDEQQNRAIQAYQEYKNQNPDEKLGEDALLSFADYFYRKKRYSECLEWLQEYQTVFPHGKLADNAALLEINIYTSNGEFDKALKANAAFRERFAGSPLEATVLYNHGYLNFMKKDFDSALIDLNQVVTHFAASDNVENARFFIGICLYELKRYDEAIQTLQSFEKEFPKSKLIPDSIFHRAKACEDKKDHRGANELYGQILKNYPKDELAPFSLFAMARDEASQGIPHSEDALKLFDQFLAQFPTHSLAPSAFLFKGAILRNTKRLDEALAIYQALAEKFPDNPTAAEALVLTAELNFQSAERMAARPERLPPERMEEWKKTIQSAQTSCEKVIRQFAKAPSVDKALSLLVQLWQKRIEAAFATKDEAKAYFDQLASSGDASLRVKVAFAFGSMLEKLNEKQAALQVLSDAYDHASTASLPNEGYNQYRRALIEAQQLDRAIAVSERQRVEKQEAQDPSGVAEAILGLGQVYLEKGDFPKATASFKEVISNFPWHETAAPQAEFYLALSQERQKDFQEAIKLYNVLLSKIQDPEMRVQVFFRLGYCWYGQFEKSPEQKFENLKQALAYFLKIGTAFTSFPTYASESLYMAASLYEKMALLSPDAKVKQECRQNSLKFYKRCLEEFPSTTWGEKSKEKLAPLLK